MKARLIDGVRRSEESANFEVPTYRERASLKPGNFAHVGIEFGTTPEGCNGERFWVHVSSNANGKYTGTVANALIGTDLHGLKYGDPVTFHADHVLDTWEDGE